MRGRVTGAAGEGWQARQAALKSFAATLLPPACVVAIPRCLNCASSVESAPPLSAGQLLTQLSLAFALLLSSQAALVLARAGKQVGLGEAGKAGPVHMQGIGQGGLRVLREGEGMAR